jgi:non-specific serine/threonine protein kinase
MWFERLEQEHGNIRAALSWSLGGGSAGLGLRLAVALYMFWYTRGYLIEGRGWLEKAISENQDVATHARARALNSTGWMALFQGKLEEAVPLLEEGLALFRRLDDAAGTASALYNLGVTLVACLDYERAELLLAEAADLQRTLREPAGVARSLQALSLVALAQQRYRQAMTVAEEGLMLSGESDDKVGIVLQDCSLALAQLGLGKREQADVRCADALKTALELKWKHGIAMSLQVSGAIAGSREHAIRAARIWGAGDALRATIGATLSPFEQHYYGPFIEAVRTRLGEADFEAAWYEGRTMSPEQAIEYALSAQGDSPRIFPETVAASPDLLTRREKEVAELVAQGLANRRIAQQLMLSEHTVKNHVAHILKKLDLHSRAQIPSHIIRR